ncbi:sterol carrier family protein [Trueperella bialowiezensis]|uniref:Bacterial SCP orthologue domain-containing protein n=1 Tax=Trueperella bialowiezensis TaxID=312285 RepID=A0A3S4VTU4_9ACTO|nr:sterol carrier family protein [Trueperella bialowiezensis]VEI13578.1 Uncharacterised protein [Trueperella bialowiezensis]
MRRRIDPDEGLGLIRAFARGEELSTRDKRQAARFALEEFASRHPGRSVEIRIPWAGAVQAIAGPEHTRGTPPNVVEMDVDTFLALATSAPGDVQVDPAKVTYSGTRANISEFFPIFRPVELGQPGH